ncbi:MAG: TlpA disulfide reductase family protein [Mucilaginibacter sp.]
MKNRFTLLALAALSVLVYSCIDKAAFTISATLKNPGNLKMAYLLEADSSSINVVDSTQVKDGEFSFKHRAPYANLYKLRIGGAVFDIIAKNGEDIKFTTDLKDEKHPYDITGSPESEKIKDYNKIINFYGDKNGLLVNEYQAKVEAIGHETDSLTNIYRPLFQKNIDASNGEVLTFINNNKKSLAAFYAMTSLDPIQYEQQMVAYADAIKDDFKDNPAVQHFIRQIELVKPVSLGHKAPDFTIAGIDGKPIKLSDYKGKYVMLDFWASWCAPCRQENPNVVKQYAKFHSKGFNILGISLDEKKEDWQQAINADKLTWQHGSDLKRFEGPTESLYRIDAIPSNFIIDPQGVIIAKNITGKSLEDFLNKTFSGPQ